MHCRGERFFALTSSEPFVLFVLLSTIIPAAWANFLAGRLPLPRAPGRILIRPYSGFSDGFHFAPFVRLQFLRFAPDQLGGQLSKSESSTL